VKLDEAALEAHPLPPVIDGDKETKGRILVIAGSRQVPGAALLTATAAMRAGAGKLAIACVESIAVQVGIAMPEALVVGLAEDPRGGFDGGAVDPLIDRAGNVDAVVAGPGMDDSETSKRIAAGLMDLEARLAFDAGLLRALDTSGETRSQPPILLPHSGELAALLDCDEQAIERDPISCGHRAAERYASIVLVKGVTSHVVCPEGEAWTYEGGAPGLGVSGSGDVLAGIVGGLLGRGAEPLNALLWAVWLHGEAGVQLAKKIGPIGFLAREIADEVPPLLPR
jgi:hydroxyethylthiazole kinase-like uncharacterized protein yjeF